jgi:hypothetical protein
MENEATATKYGAELGAEGALYQGSAAQTSSYYGAAGTLASGAGATLNMGGKFFFPARTI